MTILFFRSAVFVKLLTEIQPWCCWSCTGGKEWMSFFPFPFLSFLPLSHLSLKAPNQQENLSFLRTFSLLGDAGSGNRGESSFIPFPSFTVPMLSFFFLCIYIAVMRRGRRDSSTDHSLLTNRKDGCGVVVTTAEQLVWMKRDMKPRPSFLFSPGPFWIQWICKLPWIKLAISKLVT